MPRKLAKETTKKVKKMGAKESSNSGATQWGRKSDAYKEFDSPICWGDWLGLGIECKLTTKESYGITKEVLEKFVKDSKKNYLPLLLLGFVDEKTKRDKDYFIIRKDDFLSIMEYIDYLHSEIKTLENSEIEKDNLY